MKYPGQPEDPPSWYNPQKPSYIEEKFSEELEELADAIENEHWFGDPQKHSRYRVDFILKDARLIVELDGYAYHSTPAQLKKDAIRQRYLSRAGYTVIRFTGSEIACNPAARVSEVRTIYKERMQRAPATYRVMYVDYPFLHREMSKTLEFYQGLHPDKELSFVSLEEIIPYAIEWLHEKSFVTVFVFHPPEDATGIEHLNGFVKEYSKGEIRINTMSSEWYSCDLGDHMKSYSHLFDEFFLIGDDPLYVGPLRSVLPKDFSERKLGNHTHQFLAKGKLLRKNNDETSYAGTDLAHVLWQDVWYIIGASMGLSLYEL